MNFKFGPLSLAAALACVSSVALAQNPFAGTWKIDISASHFPQDVITITQEPNGQVRMDQQSGPSFTFKLDGSDSPTPMGGITLEVTQPDDHTWHEVMKKGDTALGTDTLKLSADGQTLNSADRLTRPDGSQYSEDESFTRMAPGNGFFGKWKSTKESHNTPDTMDFQANGDDGILWNWPEFKTSVSLRFDGKDVAISGPTLPEGMTFALRKTDPHTLEMTEKMKGKVVYQSRMVVSPDGTTLTETVSIPASDDPEKRVYRKS